jgi:hypothetical protein
MTMQKDSVIRSHKYLAGARDQACVNCGSWGTVVSCHYQGFRSASLGGGKARKVSDLFVADLCQRCHSHFDGYDVSDFGSKYMRQIDQSEQFLFRICQTLERRIKQGLISVVS